MQPNRQEDMAVFYPGTGLDGVNVFDFIHPEYQNFSAQRFKEALRGVTSEPAVIKVLLAGQCRKKHLKSARRP